MYAKKNSRKKLLVLLVVLMLLVGIAAGGTVAWLITQTEPIVNTFVKGDIDITLTEPNFVTNTEDGRYKAIPGDAITKDPTVTVKANSEDCYVRVFVINWWTTETDKYFQGSEAADWYNFNGTNWNFAASYIDETSDQVLGHVFEFRYREEIATSEQNTTLPAPFTTITVPDWITGDKYASLDNYKVIVIAQAVQAEGFADANAAFTAAGLPAAELALEDGVSKTIDALIADLKNQPSTQNP